MLRTFHHVAVAVLFVSHSLFLFRGLSVRARGIRPSWVDRLSRLVSQIALMATVAGGIALLASPHRTPGLRFFPHGLAGLLPAAAIPIVSVVRLTAGRSRAMPWLLPALNLGLISLAAVTALV